MIIDRRFVKNSDYKQWRLKWHRCGKGWIYRWLYENGFMRNPQIKPTSYNVVSWGSSIKTDWYPIPKVYYFQDMVLAGKRFWVNHPCQKRHYCDPKETVQTISDSAQFVWISYDQIWFFSCSCNWELIIRLNWLSFQ